MVCSRALARTAEPMAVMNDSDQVALSNKMLDPTILKSAHAITESIGLTELFNTLASLMLQASAAERLVLLLPDEVGNWYVRVLAATDEVKLLKLPLLDTSDLPIELIQSVLQAQKICTDSVLTCSPDAKVHSPKSLLCLPLTHQCKTVGVAYFDHHTLNGLFTPDRITVLDFLGQQGAISIEKLILSQALEQKFETQDAKYKEAEFLRTTAENLPGYFWRIKITPDNKLIVLYITANCEYLYDVSAESLINGQYSFVDFVHEDDLQRVELWLCEVGQKTPAPNDYEFRVVTPSGIVKWVRVTGRCKSRSPDGSAIYDGVTLDITARKAVEQELQDAENRLKDTIENLPGMVFRLVNRSDGSKSVLYVSPQVTELYELEVEQVLADFDVVHSRKNAKDVESVEKQVSTLDPLGPIQVEYRVNLPGQGVRWHRSFSRGSRTEEGIIRHGFIIDVTDHKNAELQLQQVNKDLAHATKMKDEFLANMSHELRTPLTAILASSEGLQHGIFGEVTPTQFDCVKVIQESGLHLLDLINEVLDLAKIESGSMKLDFSEIDLNRICESSLQMVNQQAKEKNISIETYVPDILPLLQADEVKVRQILVNLLSNAVKFTTTGGRVQLRLECVPADNDSNSEVLRFVIKDNGVGIEKSKLESLFDPFVQVQTSLNRENGGTGLGLALVKRFSELHGGGVSVSSKAGVGSVFSVDLPLIQKSYATDHATLLSSHGNEQKHNSLFATDKPVTDKAAADQAPLVLLAEDNKGVAVATSRYLEMKKFRVHWVADGEDAVAAALELESNVILMDIRMPRFDGLQAIKQLRKIPALKDTPIIALTGLAMQDDEQRCIRAGADRYLSKPYRMQELVDLIRELLYHEEA